MRLINVHTRELEFFQDERSLPPYAILSHMWTDKEVSYADLFNYQARFKDLDYAKIRQTCEQAKKDLIDYVWVDTVCIDKKSSSELSEAINSMFRWYEKSSVCYVYMNDVGAPHQEAADLTVRHVEVRHDSVLPGQCAHSHGASAAQTQGHHQDSHVLLAHDSHHDEDGANDSSQIHGEPEVTLHMGDESSRRAPILLSPSDGAREHLIESHLKQSGQKESDAQIARSHPPAASRSSVVTSTRRLKDSRWFMRGFTLQELLAPRRLVFYDHEWRLLGGFAKADAVSVHRGSDLSESITDIGLTFLRDTQIIDDISNVTGIPEDVLMHRKSLYDVGVATKMSWAAHRETRRLEDEAYCLLGIFDINMPMLYGEGKKAFARLQEEIIRSTTDQTVFAWSGPERQLLASSPASFANSGTLVPRDRSATGDTYDMTNRGLRIMLPVIWKYYDVESKTSHSLAILDCVDLERPGHCVCLAFPQSHPGSLRSRITEVDLQDGHLLVYVPFKNHRDRAASPALAPKQRLLVLKDHRPVVVQTSFHAQISVLDNRARYSCRCYPEGQWDEDSLTTLMDQDHLPEPRVVHLAKHDGNGAGALIAFGISLGPSPQHVYFSLQRHRGHKTASKVDELVQRLQEDVSEGPNARRWAYLPVTRSIIISWSTKVEIKFELASVGQNRDGWMIVLQPRQTRLRRWVGLAAATAFLPVALPWMILSETTERVFGGEPEWLTAVCQAHGDVIDKCIDGAYVFRHW